MFVRRDRCVYRETTADNSTKPMYVVDSLFIVIEQCLLISGLGYKSDPEGGGEERRGGMEAWLWPRSRYLLWCWQGIQTSCQTSILSAR